MELYCTLSRCQLVPCVLMAMCDLLEHQQRVQVLRSVLFGTVCTGKLALSGGAMLIIGDITENSGPSLAVDGDIIEKAGL